MKLCPVCLKQKPFANFYKNASRKDGYQRECKACKRVSEIRYYTKNKDEIHQRTKAKRIENLLKLHKFMADKKCVFQGCPVRDTDMLTFDHLDPTTKKAGVSDLAKKGYAWETVINEIAKCRILCFNHHMKHTIKQFGWKKYLDRSSDLLI